VQQGIEPAVSAAGPQDAADLAAAALDADDLPGFLESTEQATDYPVPLWGEFMVAARYEAGWAVDPAGDSGVPAISLALSLHNSADDAQALMLNALQQFAGNDAGGTAMEQLGSQGLGNDSVSASWTVQYAGEQTKQMIGVAFRRGGVSVVIVGGGSLNQLTAYGQIVDQRLVTAGA
jgi:hypothetical protein